MAPDMPERTNRGIIDYIAEDPQTGVIILAIVETRKWDGSRARMMELQDKLNKYLAFALDGEMARRYPDMSGKPLRIELFCKDDPDPETQKFLDFAKRKLSEDHIEFAATLMR